jgi:hypothetical protein
MGIKKVPYKPDAFARENIRSLLQPGFCQTENQ